MFLQLLAEWREDQSKLRIMFTQEMLVAKPEPDLQLWPTGLECLTWSFQVSCIAGVTWLSPAPVRRGPGVLGWA